MPQRIGIVVAPKDIPGCLSVTNPTCHLHEDVIHLLCRLINFRGISEIRRILLAIADYKILSVDDESLITGLGEAEQLGCEDPRIVEIEETHLLTYTAVREVKPNGPWTTRIAFAFSDNLKDCQRLGLFLPEEGDNKDGVLLPQKVDGQYWLYHRFHPNVWIASSEDLRSWTNVRPVMFCRPGWWDSARIGIGTVLATNDGWLAFYHGADTANTYRVGAVLFDKEKPFKVLARSFWPLLEPKRKYEKVGLMPNVVFPCGAFQKNSTYVVFYGGADLVSCVCEFSVKEVMNNLKTF